MIISKNFYRTALYLSFFVTVSLFSPLVQAAQIFNDVPRTHPDYTAIDFLATENVIKGYEDGSFRSEEPITRAASLKILLIGSGIPLDVSYQADAFSDLTNKNDWFIPYVMKAYTLEIVKGNDTDHTFAAASPVNLAAFSKMLLIANHINTSSTQEQNVVPGIDMSQWYGPYINKAVILGIVSANDIDPNRILTRGDVVRMMYLMKFLLKSEDTQFLLNRAEAEMAQIEIYVSDENLLSAKTSSRRAYNLTQQAYKNLPTNTTVLGAAKLAVAYDLLMDMLFAALEKNKNLALEKGNLVIIKATEAWQANNATQPIGAYLKERAREIAAQIGIVLNE